MKSKRHLYKAIKQVTCNLQKVLSESVKSIKKVLKLLGSVRKLSRHKFSIIQSPATNPQC